jgi:hypothetical protein
VNTPWGKPHDISVGQAEYKLSLPHLQKMRSATSTGQAPWFYERFIKFFNFNIEIDKKKTYMSNKKIIKNNLKTKIVFDLIEKLTI